jgi:predicted GNAT family N-acyltransferase
MEPVKETEASDLVIRIIDELVVHDYLEDGVWAFLKCVQPDPIMRRSRINHFVLTAEMYGQVIGTIEVRDNNHISLFCVEREYRQRGIGRRLLQKALELCVKYNPQISEVSVNSLPSIVNIYERLGFHPEKPEMMASNIPYTPMYLELSKGNNLQTIGVRSQH